MLLLNSTLIGDALSVCDSPIDVEKISYAEIEHGKFDYLYITNDVSMDLPSFIIPIDWDANTLLYGKFNGDTNAGNVYFTLNDIDKVLIKRRAKDYKGNWGKWMTIYYKPISSIEDMSIVFHDLLASSRTNYEYGLFPIKQDIEKIPYTTSVYCKFDGIYVVGIDENNTQSTKNDYTDQYGNLMLTAWGTPITDGNVDTTRNISKTYNVLLNNKYPVSVSSTIANYYTGTVNGSWYPFDLSNCEFISDGQHVTGYVEDFMSFLTNGMPKLIKNLDGRTWLAEIDASPTNNAVDGYDNRQVSFNFTETGNYQSESDLYYSHLSAIPERWWNG